MSTIETHHQTVSHSPHANPSISASVLFGTAITAGLFSILGFFIGLDRSPGSFYTYGFSCFFWPVVGMVALGAVIGGCLGFIFGHVAHASDEPEQKDAPAIAQHPRGLATLHH